jgi:hypothetical protein
MTEFKTADVVTVYDRYRFDLPLKAEVVGLSTKNDGVSILLQESNNLKYPVGSTVWVHAAQLRKDETATATPENGCSPVWPKKGITIKVEKVWKDGQKMYKVLEVSALMYRSLSEEYLQGRPAVALTNFSNELWIHPLNHATGYGIRAESYVSEQLFKEILAVARAAGERLAEINRKVVWSGVEEFKI